MGELDSIWLYQEDADVLKQKLQNARLELEALKLEATVTKKQTKVTEKRLQSLLQMAYKERDDAREQLKSLLSKINPKPAPSSTAQNHLLMIPNSSTHLSDDSNLYLKQQRANSSITESNTLSEIPTNLNTNSHGSSPVDSIYDTVTSPELSTMNSIGGSGNNVGFVNNHHTSAHDRSQGQVQTHSTKMSGSGSGSGSTSRPDVATTVIDGLVKGKVLPQKGKLLEAVMDAGPLLQTLMLAGPLPSWRNPPPLQPFKIPQVAGLVASITGSDYINAALPMRPGWSSTPFAEMTCGTSSHMETHSMLNFGSGVGNNGRFMSTLTPQMVMMNVNNQIASGKRRRLM